MNKLVSSVLSERYCKSSLRLKLFLSQCLFYSYPVSVTYFLLTFQEYLLGWRWGKESVYKTKRNSKLSAQELLIKTFLFSSLGNL